MILSRDTVSITRSNSTGHEQEVMITVIDQNGQKVFNPDYSKFSVKCTNAPATVSTSTVNNNINDYVQLVDNVLKCKQYNVEAGVYTYEVTYYNIHSIIRARFSVHWNLRFF